jgi:2-aminoadipate transaminase
MDAAQILQTNLPPGWIDLGLGNPDLDLLPLELLRGSAEAYFKTRDTRPLQYGLEQGDGYFRLALASFLERMMGGSVNPDCIFVTTGASAGLDLLCSLYAHPGDNIFVEEPTYFLALRIFADHGLHPIPIPIDSDGMCIDAVIDKLAGFRPKFIYTVPTYQNPSGRTLSQARRQKLVELVQEHNILLVADEVYHFLPYCQAPPQPFARWSEAVEQVISVHSFSKILAPGLRLGWIQAHANVIQRLAGSGLLDSGGGMSPFLSALARGVVDAGGLEQNIRDLRAAYAARLAALDAALRQHLPAAEYERPQGGFFIWARLPGLDTDALRPKAQACSVDFRPGSLFSSQHGLGEYLRLGFCHYKPDALAEGVLRLAACMKR